MDMAKTPRNKKGQFLQGAHWRPVTCIRNKDWLYEQYIMLRRSTSDIAKEMNVTCVALTGFTGGKSGELADVHINTPSHHMGHIEDLHMSLCHMVAFHFMDNEQHHIS